MAFKPIDPKRDEFRRYLERSGVIESLTKVFVRIVRERPENPLDYLRHNLGDSVHQADNVAYLHSELEDARCEINRLRTIIENVYPEALNEPSHGDEEYSVENAALENLELTNRKASTIEKQINSEPNHIQEVSTYAPTQRIEVQKLDHGNMETPVIIENHCKIEISIPPELSHQSDKNS